MIKPGCARTFLHQNQWIHGVTVYGNASNAATAEGRAEMDEMLTHVTSRIVHNMKGKRFICGDFNHLDGTLEQTKLWERLGWREIQFLEQERTGQAPRLTCQDSTIKDFLWISPELAPYFQTVHYDNLLFKEHALLGARFSPFDAPARIPIWRKPKPFDWEQIGTLPTGTSCFQSLAQTADPCQQLAQEFEARVSAKLVEQGKPPPMRCQLGRARTKAPTLVPEYSKAATPSRHGSFQPNYGGTSVQYNQWFKQLRRLEAYARAQQKNRHSTNRVIHMHREWRAILHAPGFPQGFLKWWTIAMPHLAGTPSTVPADPPESAIALPCI